jgi:integrase
MPRPKSNAPSPAARVRSGKLLVRWTWRRNVIEVSLGDDPGPKARERLLLDIGYFLSVDEPFSRHLAHLESTAPVKRYRRLRAGVNSSGDVLADYLVHLRANVSPGWASTSEKYLEKLKEACPALTDISRRDAMDIIDGVAATRARGTRNKYLQVYSRFFKWLVATGRAYENPFEGLRYVQERSSAAALDIAYLTKEERSQALYEAESDPYALAVWIGVYTGMRRGEIWGADWKWVHLDAASITVPESKVGRARTIPICRPLLERLAPLAGEGPVVPRKGSWLWQATAMIERLRKRCPDIDPKAISWNGFRHTFASLLVQGGVPLDTVAALLGDSVETCRLHYARFIPKAGADGLLVALE